MKTVSDSARSDIRALMRRLFREEIRAIHSGFQVAGGFAFVACALAGAFLISYGLGAEMLNFGALIAFMGVNAAAFLRYFVRSPEKKLTHLVPPIAGFLICLLLWLNLSRPAKIAGTIWMAAGIAFGAWKTRGFRHDLVDFELPPEAV